jgi:hypothetical protein
VEIHLARRKDGFHKRWVIFLSVEQVPISSLRLILLHGKSEWVRLHILVTWWYLWHSPPCRSPQLGPCAHAQDAPHQHVATLTPVSWLPGAESYLRWVVKTSSLRVHWSQLRGGIVADHDQHHVPHHHYNSQTTAYEENVPTYAASTTCPNTQHGIMTENHKSRRMWDILRTCFCIEIKVWGGKTRKQNSKIIAVQWHWDAKFVPSYIPGRSHHCNVVFM